MLRDSFEQQSTLFYGYFYCGLKTIYYILLKLKNKRGTIITVSVLTSYLILFVGFLFWSGCVQILFCFKFVYFQEVICWLASCQFTMLRLTALCGSRLFRLCLKQVFFCDGKFIDLAFSFLLPITQTSSILSHFCFINHLMVRYVQIKRNQNCNHQSMTNNFRLLRHVSELK